MFTKKLRLLTLVGWTLLLGLVYWGLGETEYTMAITYTYAALCLLFSVAYLLVSGGLQPILAQDRVKEAKTREKYLADKGKMHPIKRKDKYRRFRIKSEEEKSLPKEAVPDFCPPNPLKLPENVRQILSPLLLVLGVPFYLIFLGDWIYLQFFI